MVGVILENHKNLQMVDQSVSIKGEPFKTYNAVILFFIWTRTINAEKF